jgi:hypothetical protein
MNWDIILFFAILIFQETPKVEPGSWITTFTIAATIAAAALGGSFGTYKSVQKIRDNARKAKAAEEAEINRRISEAVERKRSEMQTSVEMSQQAAAHWKDMVDLLEKEKVHDREVHMSEKVKLDDEVVRIREERNTVLRELDEKRIKLEKIVDLNLGLQGQINENAQEIKQLRDRQLVSEHRQDETDKGK